MNTHPLGYKCDPETGVVYGLRGAPIRKRDGKGYIRATRAHCSYGAHRLMWEAAHGQIPDGMQINHINGIKTDNRLANLEVVTQSQNIRHGFALGLYRQDLDHNTRAILSVSAAAAIRAKREAGHSITQLAAEYGVARRTVRNVLDGRAWVQQSNPP